MKKWIMMFSLCLAVFLSGCSLVEGVNQSLDYVNKTTIYVNEVVAFADEIQPIAAEAIASEEARMELEQKLESMKTDIQTFNEIQPPGIAAGIHEQLIEHNATLENGVNLYLEHIENGELDIKVLEEVGIINTIMDMTSILDQIKSLGE
ncbi:hypothetical protein GN156_05785 [bacterium LRH843]|nr:hypothetical protein [bacterium LRH843]